MFSWTCYVLLQLIRQCDVILTSGGGGTTGFEGGATPIADCGGYGAGCPIININPGMVHNFE
jgi:hypothetical protein